jgi:hypothetical protein
VLGHVSLFKAKTLADVAYRHLSLVAQQLNDGDAGRVRQSLKKNCLKAAEAVLHSHCPTRSA